MPWEPIQIAGHMPEPCCCKLHAATSPDDCQVGKVASCCIVHSCWAQRMAAQRKITTEVAR